MVCTLPELFQRESSSILQHKDGLTPGCLFTLASTLRKSCNCGKVTDTLPRTKLTKLLEAELGSLFF